MKEKITFDKNEISREDAKKFIEDRLDAMPNRKTEKKEYRKAIVEIVEMHSLFPGLWDQIQKERREKMIADLQRDNNMTND